MRYFLSPDKMHALLLDKIIGFDIYKSQPYYKINVMYKDHNGIHERIFVENINNLVDAQEILVGLINTLNKIEPEGRSLEDTRKVNINA